ncbi:MAG TPA: YdeI/OmpD-associated family protein [Terriglobales bacterium]|nr:YdeI/OmpD-associated family protein [Terriglobales bacterium]
MPKLDKKIDTYIAKSPEFSRPILTELRAIVHQACPEAEETIKWSCPHYLYKGKILCSTAAFKLHCAFHIWHGGQVVAAKDNKSDEAMGQFGRITSSKDLPSNKTLVGYLKKAMELIDSGATRFSRPKPKSAKKELVIPEYFTMALKKNEKAHAAFDSFSYSRKKEYVEWITEAKTEETRERRMATALEWIAEGKSRNWKYEKC